MSYPVFASVSLESVEASLVELILNTNLPIDQIEQRWFGTWSEQVHADQLADIWNDVTANMPELN
jgi:hypothetical protein